MTVELRRLQGAALAAALDDLARLRIEVFREWPYLYDGDLGYERDYLSIYVKVKTSVVAAAYEGARMIGAATGSGLADHADDFGAAFAGFERPITDVFYCAESVLLPSYRGRGLGHAFFDAREAHARKLGYRFAAFCSVIRPADHPLRPQSVRDLEPFWRKRGYAPLQGRRAKFSWRDVGQSYESAKELQFWGREL